MGFRRWVSGLTAVSGSAGVDFLLSFGDVRTVEWTAFRSGFRDAGRLCAARHGPAMSGSLCPLSHCRGALRAVLPRPQEHGATALACLGKEVAGTALMSYRGGAPEAMLQSRRACPPAAHRRPCLRLGPSGTVDSEAAFLAVGCVRSRVTGCPPPSTGTQYRCSNPFNAGGYGSCCSTDPLCPHSRFSSGHGCVCAATGRSC